MGLYVDGQTDRHSKIVRAIALYVNTCILSFVINYFLIRVCEELVKVV